MRKVIRDILKAHDIKVAGRHGLEADMAQEINPDATALDLNMPSMTD